MGTASLSRSRGRIGLGEVRRKHLRSHLKAPGHSLLSCGEATVSDWAWDPRWGAVPTGPGWQ